MSRSRFIDPRAGRGMFADREPADRPPIVLISIDMVPPDFHRNGETNSGLANTPALDQLRAEGVWFANAFANSPLCGPSRASDLTGRHPYLLVNEERAHDGMEVFLRPGDIIFPEYLRAAGYVTKHAGKCHVGAHKFRDPFGEGDAAWDRWVPPLTDDDGYLAPNPAVAFAARTPDGGHYWYAYNLTSDCDELYDLTDPTYRNRIGEPELNEVRVEMVRRLSAVLRADSRWRCYRQTFRLDKAADLPPEEGDLQMLRPE